MRIDKFKQLLHRYLNEEAGEAEKRAVDAWYDSYTDKRGVEVFGDEAQENQLNTDIYAAVKGYWHPVRKNRWRIYLPYAAAVVLVSLFAVLFFYGPGRSLQEPDAGVAFRVVKTGVNQVKRMVLPDSSSLWVNAASVVRIPNEFNQRAQRMVFVDEGEAYFDVTQHAGKPFVVYAGPLRTFVLGTSFNVRNYTALGRVSIQVQSGRVRVAKADSALTELTAQRQLVYRAGKKQFEIADVLLGTADWRQGVLRLRDADMKELALTIRNMYGVDLSYDPQVFDQFRYTMVLRASRTLEETMKIVCSVHQNSYRRAGNEVIIY